MRSKKSRAGKNDKHLTFIRRLPCLRCLNDICTEAAHLRISRPGKFNAKGKKPDDKYSNPLCSRCHYIQTNHPRGEAGFWDETGIDPFESSERLYDVSGDVVRGEEIVHEIHNRSRRGTKMTKAILFATTAAIVAFGGLNAMAADLNPVLVTKAPSSPAYDWSGFYAGLNVGAGWGTNSSTLKSFSGNATDTSLSSEPVSGFVGGGQIGYNYQLQALVLGIEGSAEWLGISGQGPCLVALNCSDKATWEADLAARVGFAAGPLMLYGKGGIAWAHYDHGVTFPGVFSTSASETPVGVLVGAGVEYLVTRNLAARLEYDFIGFQDQTLNQFSGGAGVGGGRLNSVDYRKDLSMLKAGVSYKF